MNRVRFAIPLLTLTLSLLVSSPALAFDLFRSRDADVERGNQRMAEQDYSAAREAYEAAVRRLPSEGAVHLDRGLALMAAGDLDPARAAFLAATEPPADRAIRSAAYYDLGLAFYRQGDAAATGSAAAPAAAGGAAPSPSPLPGAPGASGAAAGPGAPPAAEPDHREAQRLFREAADGFRRSLRLKPGNRDAAWNLELALRRIQEEEDAQRQQDQQNQQNQQNQDPQNQQNQDPQNQQNQDPQNQQNQDQQGQDQQDQQGQDQQNQQNQDQQNQDQQDRQNQDQQGQDQQDQQGQDQQNQDRQGQGQQGQDQQDQQAPAGQALPEHSRRLLDALQDGEESLQQLRARQRGGRDRRAPAQDW